LLLYPNLAKETLFHLFIIDAPFEILIAIFLAAGKEADRNFKGPG